MECVSRHTKWKCRCMCVWVGQGLHVFCVYQSGSHWETKFASDVSNIETVMNGLFTEVWAETLRHQHQWKKPLPPYNGNWGSPSRSPFQGWCTHSQGLGISTVVDSQLTLHWVALSHHKGQLHSGYTPSWGWPRPMTIWCRNTKTQPPFLNLGHFWRATPAPELPVASSEASLNCISC